jgi:hypothetical protein
MMYRVVYMDGRPHPEDPDLTFHGHSTGKWDGDTLVIESVGFAEQNRLAPGIGRSWRGSGAAGRRASVYEPASRSFLSLARGE